MSNTINDRTLALAGIYQAVYLVDQIAHTGRCDSDLYESAIHTLFVISPRTTEEVYGSRFEVRKGLQLLLAQLGNQASEKHVQLTRYAIALLYLERKLAKQPALLDKIADGLERARKQSEHFATTHANVIASLADTYLNTVSTLQPRIMVTGDTTLLQQPDNANRIRALLLAGIRSAVLWKQNGGGRWQLLFKRRAMIAAAEQLLKMH